MMHDDSKGNPHPNNVVKLGPPSNPNGVGVAKEYLIKAYTGRSVNFQDFISILRTRKEINNVHIRNDLGASLLGIFRSSEDKDELLLELLDVVKDTDDKKYILSLYRKLTINNTGRGGVVLA